jgi:hypothetical protein
LALQEREILMKKRLIVALTLMVIAVIALSSFAAIEDHPPASTHAAAKKPFYVGVTFCGDSIADAEQLIDKVKDYTNLFVLQSGPLMYNVSASEQICDYAVKSGLNIIVIGSINGLGTNLNGILSVAQTRWGSHFLGLYVKDEPGGKMLDSQQISLPYNDNSVSRGENGQVQFSQLTESGDIHTTSQYTFNSSGVISISSSPADVTPWSVSGNQTTDETALMPTQTIYYPNGTIAYTAYAARIFELNGTVLNQGGQIVTKLTYEPNGTVLNQNGQIVTNQENMPKLEPYQQVLELNPLLNDTDVAKLYVNNLQSTLSSVGNQSYVKLFTSDYALYWFDYQGGYDGVFAELFGWQTDAQTLALVRGAVDMQNKSWGVMIEPESQSPITLQTGDQIYGELQQAYEDGAEYGVVFNYAPNDNGIGLLQDSQFSAIQKFWTDVVQNPKDINNVTAQDALVLPTDYGWGMRSQNDTIWGIWQPDASSQQIWNAMQSSLAQFGSKLDIVYDDPAHPTAGRYQHVYYWNQTI